MSIVTGLSVAVRNRDWGAALIDIGIVAIGILMALAVDNWREDREVRLRELHLIKEARAEASQIATEEMRDFWRSRLEKMGVVRRLLLGESPDRELCHEEC